MSTFAELRATLIRRAVGIQGFVHEREARAVLDWCGDLLTVRHSRFAREGSYTRRSDGGFDITVPSTARDDVDAFRQLHEVGHGFLDLPPQERPREPLRIGRLGWQAVSRDERENEVFLDALRLPRELLGRYLDWDDPDLTGLAEDSECAEPILRRRLEWVRSHPAPTLLQPPVWCAVHGYRVLERRTELVRALVLVATDRSETLELPVRNETESRLLRRQLAGSLYALRPHEFALKYSMDRAVYYDATVYWSDWIEPNPGKSDVSSRVR